MLDRLVRARVHPELMNEFLATVWSGDGVFCVDAFPLGSVFIECFVDSSGYLRFVFSHESFSVVDGVIPEIRVIYRREFREL